MTLIELIPRMATFFSTERIPYFVFGAVGMDVWAGPRSTHDLDVVVCVDTKGIRPLADKLRKMGFRLVRDQERKLAEGKIIQLSLGKTGLDLKTCVSRHDLKSLERSKMASVGPVALSVATPEDIVLYKLQSWRIQDQADIDKIRREVGDLNVKYIESWLDPLASDCGQPLRERWLMAVRGLGGAGARDLKAMRAEMRKLADENDRRSRHNR